MSYLQNKRKQKIKLYIAILLAILLVFIFLGPAVLKGLSGVANFVFKPFAKFGQNVGDDFSDISSSLKSKKSLIQENEILKKKLQKNTSKISNYNSVLKENISLKESLGRLPNEGDFVLGTILAKPDSSLFGTLLVDIGSSSGLSEGDLVFALGDIPVGRVHEVFKGSSKVLLFSSPGVETEVIFGQEDIFMKLIGRGGGNFEMDIPRDFPTEEGQPVVMAGINPYTIAVVKTIISDPRDSFSKALFVSPVNIQNIKFVQILR